MGQLGLGHANNVKEPTILFGGKKVNKIYATRGWYASAYLQDENNFFYACGYNAWGQLGVGDTAHRNTWTRVPSLDPIKDSIIKFNSSGRGDNLCYNAVIFHAHYNNTRTLFCAGYNGVGNLSQGHYNNLNKFTQIKYGPRDVADFHINYGEDTSGSWPHALMVKDKNDELWLCGQMDYYMEGNPYASNNQKRLNCLIRSNTF